MNQSLSAGRHAFAGALASALVSCHGGARQGSAPEGNTIATTLPSDATLEQVAQSRSLSPEEAKMALESFVPPGKRDEFTMFMSGGHSGSIFVVGIPSLRTIKEIPVYSPNPWQGWASGANEGTEVMKAGTFSPSLPTQTWGDLHHPALSLTGGDYDGDFIFSTDKPTGRVAVVDLRDFKTKQIVKTPNTISDHSGVVTADTEYFITSTFQPSPGGPGVYAPIEDYKDKYRGAVTFHKFNRKTGRIELENSFQMELPPYWQDLSSIGKGPSKDLLFINSLNTEMSTGGDAEGKSPMEIGSSLNEMDYLHVIPWRQVEAFANSSNPKVVMKNGIKVIPLDVAKEQGFLFLIPESKSPHGVDVTPHGEYIVTSGKLDPHVTAYSAEKIKEAIAQKKFEKNDLYGFPILKYDDVRVGYVEVGLGPLHTVFDEKGNGFTSLFLDSAIAKFTLGPPYHPESEAWKLIDKVDIHYNIGHLQAPGSNTVNPRGRYLVALNKWSVDRHPGVGPLHPQNLQLIDISGPKMRIINEVPDIGEPHNSAIIETAKVAAWRVYPPGTDPRTMEPSPFATPQGKEGVERTKDGVHVHMVAIRSHYKPDIVRVKQGDHVIWDITNVESAEDATHGFGLHGYNVTASIDPGATQRIEFVASMPGVYPWYCTEFCSALHMEMTGWMIVEPK